MKSQIQNIVLVGLVALTLAACAPTGDKPAAIAYPESPRGDTIDDYFGEEVADPYRWFEDLDTDPVSTWVKEQNALSTPYLESIHAHAKITNRLTELWNYERYGLPWQEGGLYFFERNNGLQDQDVVYVTETLDGEARVLLDPNGFSEDGTIAMSSWSVSPDGKWVAYSTSDGGTDWDTWYIRNVETGEDIDDAVSRTKFTGASWSKDSQGFYYSQYPKLEDGTGDGSKPISIYYHRIGTPQDEDDHIYSAPGDSRKNPYGVVSEDGLYLIISIWEGYDANDVSYIRLDTRQARVLPLFDQWDARYEFIGNQGNMLFFSTNKDAPKGNVIAVDAGRKKVGDRRVVIPEADEALDSIALVGGKFTAEYLQDAHSVVRIFGTDGSLVREVELPGMGSVGGFGGHADNPETFYSYTDFTTPTAIYRYSVETGESTLFAQSDPGVDTSGFESKQVFFESKDGTRIPMFITHKKGIELDGQNPTLLYGYGGFNISMTPSYRTARMVWLEMGGVLVIANLRGGGEYGEDWHRAGTKLDKQNVFDDFIAAAEWLIANNYTSTPKLAVQGGSNGGLLVGAVITQRPELFGAALPAVGVLDMLRYHVASANARQWSTDLGISENEDEYHAMRAYSPLHNIEDGVCYPPTLVTTADHDDRVVPWHSFKFGAAMQHAQGCDNPILVKVETRAGHGAGKPTWMQIEDIANEWAFLVKTLGMEIH